MVRLGAMGDIIHTLPAVAVLWRAWPRARIVWAVEPRWRPLLEGNPAVHEILETPLKAWRKRTLQTSAWSEAAAFVRRLRGEKFELAVDFQGLLKSAALARLSGAPRRAGFEARQLREPAARFGYTERYAAHRRHVVDQNLALARALAGVQQNPPPIEFALPRGVASSRLPDGEFLLASPFAGWRAKEWPLDRYAALAERSWTERRLPLLLDCAPSQVEAIEPLVARAPRGAVVPHPSSLPELIGATRRARAVIGLDSGPLHLAAALAAPGVALFGPTDPARNGPCGDSIRVLRTAGAATTYKRSRDYSPALFAIDVDAVWEALSERLDSTRPHFQVVTPSA